MKPECFLSGMLGGVALIVLLLVFGVRFTSDMMAYDASKEISGKGTIGAHDEFACPASQGELGTHFILKTANGDYVVHLAPARVMRSLHWSFPPGEQVEVVGALARYQGKPGLLAKTITTDKENARSGTAMECWW